MQLERHVTRNTKMGPMFPLEGGQELREKPLSMNTVGHAQQKEKKFR